jgi:uncharacterized protein involved in exopolysaccharide biosynthesis
MALAPITPRDRLSRLVDLGRKAARYWWLVAVFALVGGALSLGFAMTRGKRYESAAVLFYQERIQSSILSNRQEEVQRNLGDRFRELLFARAQLSQITNDPKITPFPGMDPDLAIDKLRVAVRFEARGGNNFRITYGDSDPDRAKAVTDKLTSLLKDKDEALRNDQAQMTVQFVTQQKEEAALELRKREQALAEFLAKHSEFAQDQVAEGAGIRAIRNNAKVPVNTGNPKLYALERQRQRIQARLDAPPDAPTVRTPSPPSPERLQAEAVVTDAQREVNSAQRELEDALGRYTDKHPTVIKAQEHVEAAQQKLRHAQAAVPPDDNTPLPPATPADRTKLQKELAQIEGQISDDQRSSKPAQNSGSGSGSGSTTVPGVDSGTNWVVELETQYADLRRALNEQRERVSSLADSVFRAQIDASQKSAETGGRLSIVDPAFKPVRPSGPGKTVFLLAGMVLFLALGGTIAIGLAILDDRLYRRDDIDQLDIAVLAVIPPIPHVHGHSKKKHA